MSRWLGRPDGVEESLFEAGGGRSTTDPGNVRERNPNFSLAIALISTLSVVNSVAVFLMPGSEERNVLIVITEFLTILFVINFVYRLLVAGSRTRYFVHEWGWVDLLACTPAVELSWIFRGLRAFLTFRSLTFRRIWNNVRLEGHKSALFVGLFILLVVLEVSSVLILGFEASSPDGNIRTAQDALWWAYVTIATVGYGDFYPVTTGGRLVGLALMTAGIGIFATIAGYIARTFLHRVETRGRADQVPGVSKVSSPLGRQSEEEVSERLDRIERMLEELAVERGGPKK